MQQIYVLKFILILKFYGIRQKPILIQEHRILLIKKTVFEVK